jgi:UTP--glucose-1-phosphate uridylyltransferase
MIAVIPAAGLGTRLLPTTKSVPKEMHPVRGKPAIQWVLEEAADAGLYEFIIVTNSFKFILKHYLTPLGPRHPLRGRPELATLERLLRDIKITFVDQTGPYGLGHAILQCRTQIRDRPFALLLPDNVFPSGSQVLRNLLKVWDQHGISCTVLRRASPASCAGFVTSPIDEWIHEIRRVVPKGDPEASTMQIRNVGRCIFDSEAITYLEQAQTVTELDEVPAFTGLAAQGRLLGLFTDEEVYHLGEAAFDAFGMEQDT